MDKTKKISYQSLKEKLSDNQLKRIIAGSGGNEGECATATNNCDEDRLWCCKCSGSFALETPRCATYKSDAEEAQNEWCHFLGTEATCEII